jgi:outer membrane biosynthesis protein TonB
MRIAFLVSIIIHILALLFLGWNEGVKEKILLDLKDGGSIHILFGKETEGYQKQSKSNDTKREEKLGSFQEEVNKFQNSISYPPLALEQGWESECAWLVIIGNDEKVEYFENTQPCKFKVFQEAVESNLKNWKFNLPPQSRLQLPLKFKIKYD